MITESGAEVDSRSIIETSSILFLINAKHSRSCEYSMNEQVRESIRFLEREKRRGALGFSIAIESGEKNRERERGRLFSWLKRSEHNRREGDAFAFELEFVNCAWWTNKTGGRGAAGKWSLFSSRPVCWRGKKCKQPLPARNEISKSVHPGKSARRRI